MRWVICALVVLALPPGALAGDLDVLRGSQTVGPGNFTNWTGFYVGGQYGYSDASADFSNSTQAPIAYSLRELALESEFAPSAWPVLGSADRGTSGYGGFVGYNSQWQDLILGIEANYNHISSTLVAPDTPISRITPATSGGNTYQVNIDGAGTVTNLDYATLRGRAGWVFGNFLPYGFAGVALGQADIAVSATVSGQQNPAPICSSSNYPPCYPFAFTDTAGKNSELMYGFTVGGGLDVALTQNIFLRGEYEYVQFAPVSGILVSIASAHVGAALKF
jgi:opacity protein-like surface antigen